MHCLLTASATVAVRARSKAPHRKHHNHSPHLVFPFSNSLSSAPNRARRLFCAGFLLRGSRLALNLADLLLLYEASLLFELCHLVFGLTSSESRVLLS